jgi:membrane-associated phospholipid phosphatase
MKFSCSAVSFLVALGVLVNQPAGAQTSVSDSNVNPPLSAGQPQILAAKDSRRKAPHFYEDLYAGLRMSFNRRDLAGMAALAFLDYQKPVQNFKLLPLQVDQEISANLARTDGKKSFGAISPFLYPSVAATWRMGGMILADAVGIYDYSASSYARMFRFHQALYYNGVVTHLAKRNIHRYRPDHSDTYSFFSGHTSIAFATSTFLYLEASDFIDGLAERRDGHLPLLSPTGWKKVSFGALYGWAGYVGYSRIRDRKHYLSDVIVGAASGTLISYLVYPRQTKSGKMQMGIQPQRDGLALRLGMKF